MAERVFFMDLGGWGFFSYRAVHQWTLSLLRETGEPGRDGSWLQYLMDDNIVQVQRVGVV